MRDSDHEAHPGASVTLSDHGRAARIVLAGSGRVVPQLLERLSNIGIPCVHCQDRDLLLKRIEEEPCLLVIALGPDHVPTGTLTPVLLISGGDHRAMDDLERVLAGLAGGAAARLNRVLEQRVCSRTAQLEAAMAELESFSYSVSHDLRAPLRAISGFSYALEEDCGSRLGHEGRQHLTRIQGAANRMAELIDDLLSLSRLTRGRLRRQDVDLRDVAYQLVHERRASNQERDLELRIDDDLRVNGDPSMLRIVLDNLIGNAWKFTRDRNPTCIRIGRDGQTCFVRDNGIGFDMRHAEHLFVPFQRLHREIAFEGHGIGLATVKRIILRHGGRVWAQASPGEGACFFFTLGEEDA